MKAVTFLGPSKIEVMEKPKPKIEKETDVIVKVTKTTICGTDLHILAGHVPTVEEGRILGHEGVGVVEEVGSGVKISRKVTEC